jgi:RHS repeat-associated protein
LTSVRQTSDGSTNLLTMTFTYDVLGNRAQQDKWKTGGSTVTTRFAYDGQNVWADLDGTNNLLVRYLYGSGADQILARVVSSGQPNVGVAWYLTDRLGSVRDLENGSTQTIGDHLDYDGFGNATETVQAFGDRYKFTAREWDSDSGLQYNHARYYAPTMGRWITQDPLGLGPDTNPYRYVGNRSTIAVDPLGLLPYDIVFVAVQITGVRFQLWPPKIIVRVRFWLCHVRGATPSIVPFYGDGQKMQKFLLVFFVTSQVMIISALLGNLRMFTRACMLLARAFRQYF